MVTTEPSYGGIKLQEMPPGIWRVAWLGSAIFRDRIRFYSQPTISLSIEEYEKGTSRNYCDVRAPIGALWGIPVDSVWKDGRRIEQGIGGDATIETFKISTFDAVPVKSGASIDGTRASAYWLPFSSHLHHQKHTESWCLKIQCNDVNLLIPCWEMVRFYFGSSSNLLKRVAGGIFDQRRLWIDHQFDEKTRFLKLTLAPDISGASAADIGRIALDPIARESAMIISKTLMDSITSLGYGYTRAVFPFRGRSTLQCIGRWTGITDSENSFVVSQILSCSHAFPFKKLGYVGGSASKGLYRTENTRVEGSSQQTKEIFSRNPGKDLINSEIGGRSKRTYQWGKSQRFPDLFFKKVLRVSPEEEGEVFSVKKLYAKKGMASVGDGGNGGGSRLDLTIANAASMQKDRVLVPPSKLWKPFFNFLKRLLKEEWVDELSFLSLSKDLSEGCFSRLPLLIDSDGVVISGAGERKNASVVLISSGKKRGIIISFEPQSSFENKSYSIFFKYLGYGYKDIDANHVRQFLKIILTSETTSISGSEFVFFAGVVADEKELSNGLTFLKNYFNSAKIVTPTPPSLSLGKSIASQK